MIILINASNLKQGGGIQVAQSICGQLKRFQQIRFIVVLSNYIVLSKAELDDNIELIRYDMPTTISSILFGRCRFLDDIVEKFKVNAVLTVFGPSRWKPRVPHLCGFARAQLVLRDSPYYKRRSLREIVIYKIWTWLFRKSSDVFYTENVSISKQLPELLGTHIKTYTITNYYNQVFDEPSKWCKNVILPSFDGTTCLSISSYYSHKNFEILIGVSQYLHENYPNFKFRFVLTFEEKEMPIPKEVKNHFLFIGKVEVSECPFLYEQSDIMFMPSLMECFTATYPEAMRMGVPIVTTDLEFARKLCGDAACYYSAVDPNSAGEAIYKVALNKKYAARLVANGKVQLLTYDNYEQRTEKLIGILKNMIKSEHNK